MQARYYDPVIGRFYSNDPVSAASFVSGGNVKGFNRFLYANNNPYRYLDPTGMAPCGSTGSNIKGRSGIFCSSSGDSMPKSSAGDKKKEIGQAFPTNVDSMQRAANDAMQAMSGKIVEQYLEAIKFAVAMAAPELIFGKTIASSVNFTQVGRWMSATEFRTMSATGRVVEGAGGRTFVVYPSDPAAFTGGSIHSTVYAQFEVPYSALYPASKVEWSVIPGPNVTTRLFGPAPTELAPAINIKAVIGVP